jgi:hypothetical protein
VQSEAGLGVCEKYGRRQVAKEDLGGVDGEVGGDKSRHFDLSVKFNA